MAETIPSGAGAFDGAAPLTDLVQYQGGAVVSRTIVKKAAGTVTAFAFDQGEGLSEHSAPFDALVLVAEGECEVTLSGVPHRLRAGHLMRLPAREPHGLRAVTPFKMLLIMVKE